MKWKLGGEPTPLFSKSTKKPPLRAEGTARAVIHFVSSIQELASTSHLPGGDHSIRRSNGMRGGFTSTIFTQPQKPSWTRHECHVNDYLFGDKAGEGSFWFIQKYGNSPSYVLVHNNPDFTIEMLLD